MEIKRGAASIYLLVVLFQAFFLTAARPAAAADIQRSNGQTVYVSVYSHIYSGLQGRPFDLAATLSIRNTDPAYPITIVSVKFYDTDGKLLKDYLSEPVRLNAWVSTRYIIKESEISGGSGANFIVRWKSEKSVNVPIIEAIMIGTKLGQGISFVSPGQAIEEDSE